MTLSRDEGSRVKFNGRKGRLNTWGPAARTFAAN